MTAYYALVVLVLVLALMMQGAKKGNRKYILIVTLLLLCVYGLRDGVTVGNDVNAYRLQFEKMGEREWGDLPTFSDWAKSDSDEESGNSQGRNIGNSWLMKAVYELTDGDYQAYVFTIALFVMAVFAHFVRKYSPSPVQSILYYFGLIFFTFNFSALKQSIAMAIVLLSFDAILDRKMIRFLILTMVASMFHFPALVFLPAYWIANMRLGRSYLIVLALLFVITYYFRDQLVDWMTDTYDTTVNENNTMRFLANKVIVMLVIIAAAIVIRPPSAEDRVYCSLLMLIGIAAVIQTFAGYNNTFERLADYYFQFSFVFIPMVFEDVRTKRQYLQPRMLSLARNYGPYIFCAFAIWRFIHNTSNDSNLNQYQFYFQAEKAAEELLSGRFL